jgi:hypothetical protein
MTYFDKMKNIFDYWLVSFYNYHIVHKEEILQRSFIIILQLVINRIKINY